MFSTNNLNHNQILIHNDRILFKISKLNKKVNKDAQIIYNINVLNGKNDYDLIAGKDEAEIKYKKYNKNHGKIILINKKK